MYPEPSGSPRTLPGPHRGERQEADVAHVHCTICGGALTPHDCATDCDWLECGERDCEARYFDVHRGTLLKRGGVVVRWTEA